MIEYGVFQSGISKRNRRAGFFRRFYFLSLIVAIVALITLFLTVIDRAFGTVAVQSAVEVSTLTGGRPLDSLSAEELAGILVNNLSVGRARVLIRDFVIVNYNQETLGQQPLNALLQGKNYPPEIAEKTLGQLEPGEVTAVLAQNLSSADLQNLVLEEVAQQEILESWTLFQTLLNYEDIEAENAQNHPDAELQFRSWINPNFLTKPMAQEAVNSGIRTAILGTLWVLVVTLLIAFPLGLSAAIYLEEYARTFTGNRWLNMVNSIIETNIRNLAGVPSIIYGMLGLFVFVRGLESVTQGRTVISASLTMALLILPVIIINSQEAIRAVPSSYREASFGMGATRLQTIWRQVLPAAMPGILTGIILSLSRAIGETAPLIVVGAATQIFTDPNGLLSAFTTIPIQVYRWIPLPSEEYRYIAAAAIIVVLAMLLTLNATAIILRNRFSRRLS